MAPAAVQATLEQLNALGYACGPGVADNVPSGLTQWRCPGTVAGNPAVVDVDGNDNGVAGVTIAINSIDPATSRNEFRRLATALSPLTAQPDLGSALDNWTGAQDPKFVGGARVNGECYATQCLVFITSVDGPTEPLRLP